MIKRELAAAAVLALLVGISVWNLKELEKLGSDIQIELCKAQTAAEQLNFRKSRVFFSNAFELWLQGEKHIRCALSQGRITAATEAFYQLQAALSEEDPGVCAPEFSRIRYLLESMVIEERPSLGSIL